MQQEPSPKKKKKEREFWLNAWLDHLAGLRTFSCCMDLCDVNGDGEYKLIVADAGMRLKIFSGTSLVHETALPTVPTAVASYYLDYSDELRRPCVAVASGPLIFVYKNLRRFFKLKLPPVIIPQEELNAWSDLKALTKDLKGNPGLGDAWSKYINNLQEMKKSGKRMATVTSELLSLGNQQLELDLVESTETPIKQLTVVTAMSVLQKDTDEAGGLGVLVVGTEHCQVLIVEPTRVTPFQTFNLPSVPVHLLATGLLDVQYRIVIACRDGTIYSVKTGVVTGVTIEVGSMPVGLCRIENHLAVGTMANTLQYFSLKGSKQGTVYLPAPITAMCSLYQASVRQSKAVIVALANGELRVYVGKALMNVTQLYDVVTGMQFGNYARDDATLVIVLRSGSIVIKSLPRTAVLEASESKTQGPPPEQDVPLKVPKRTDLYIQQTQRERDFGVDMHRIFQRDLAKLRLNVGRSYLRVLTDGKGSLSFNTSSSLRLTAHVQGLGPLFKIKLNVQNTGTKSLSGLPVIFTYNQRIYRLKKPYLMIPLLVPSLLYNFDVPLECLDAEAGTDVIRVYVVNSSSSIPILTALVNVPLADFLMTQ